MTATYRVTVAERADIARVSLICDECGSSVGLDAQSANVPAACPSCGRQYEDHTKAALVALGRFHREARTAEEHAGKALFRFEIRQEA